MPATIRLPAALRRFTGEKDRLRAEGRTVDEVLRNLARSHPGLAAHLFDERGALRGFVNVYVNETDVRSLDRGATSVKDGDVVSVVPAVAGGGPGGPGGHGGHRGPALSQREILRYSRHLIMPEVGMAGQKRLKEGSVLVVGTGGLGAPLAMYLAAAGVGRLGLVDFDVVDHSNLQRQVLFAESDVGRPKIKAAVERLEGLNPHVAYEPHEAKLTSANALEILKDYDVVIDGTDNFPTRYLVNDACVLLGKPNVYGSIFRFEGQASVFAAARGPCYRCLYPKPPPPGLVPSCAEGGVLGVLPGIIGSIQAMEGVKLLTGIGEPLVGRLLVFDGLAMEFRELKLRKDPKCPVCGPEPTVRELIDYEEFCGIRGEEAAPAGQAVSEWETTPAELKAALDAGRPVAIIDVREPHEWDIVHIDGAKLIPLGSIPQRVHELDPAEEYVVHCHHGGRSAKAVEFLKRAGFRKVKNLVGGIDAWAEQVEPALPRY